MKEVMLEWIDTTTQNSAPTTATNNTAATVATLNKERYVTVQVNYIDKVYEYRTKLDMQVGKCYKIKVNGSWTPRQRVKVLSISDSKQGTYVKNTAEIVDAIEVPTTF